MAPRSLAGFVDRLDAWQQKRRVPGFAVAVGQKYREDRGRQYAALLSYYGFISMFPLLLLFVWLLGVFLKDSPSLRDKILDSIIARLPVLGAQITRDADSLHLNGWAVVVGVVTLLWAGLKVVRTTQDAFNEQWGVPWMQQPGLVTKSLRGVALLAVIGGGIVAATVVTGLFAFSADLAGATRVWGALVAIALNVGLLLASFKLLTGPHLTLKAALPGSLAGGVTLWLLQLVGGQYVTRVIDSASDVYGAFATVFGLLVWIALLARVVLIAGEVNVVLHQRLWPRTFKRPTLPSAAEE